VEKVYNEMTNRKERYNDGFKTIKFQNPRKDISIIS
jgi:hypothetical protein